MITVEQALAECLSLVTPLGAETVPLRDAAGRMMASPVSATRDQPPFDASAMDGYAMAGEVAEGARFAVVGEAGAGHAWGGRLGAGEACRIFTGAPLPAGASRVVIQEDVTREGDHITIKSGVDSATHIRPKGQDFRAGETFAPRLLGANDLALLAAMNIASVPVTRRPMVAIIATGDELVMPGDTPRDDQIIVSNSFALKAMVEGEGATTRLLPIARDNRESLRAVFALARGADVIVTTGGASVGDHDLVADVAGELGLDRKFWKIAMRPGKPLMAGRMMGGAMLGLPGNPVSSIVCAHLFLLPMIRKLLGRADIAPRPRRARLAEAVAANGPRAHYMRARLTGAPDGGTPLIAAFGAQDSSLLSVLMQANALLIRPIGDGARQAGEMVDYLPL